MTTENGGRETGPRFFRYDPPLRAESRVTFGGVISSGYVIDVVAAETTDGAEDVYHVVSRGKLLRMPSRDIRFLNSGEEPKP